jgi:hypothetical protein
VYEVDGGEWLDFVGADLKHLSPRPEPRPRPEPTAQPESRRREARVEEETPVAEVETRRAPEPAPAPVEAPAPMMAMADAEPAAHDEASASRYEEPAPDYEPDQERRDKFLSRFSRWAKKS